MFRDRGRLRLLRTVSPGGSGAPPPPVVGDWWLGPWPATAPFPAETAISSTDVYAAYQYAWNTGGIYERSDAQSIANCKVNLNNPGTNNCALTGEEMHPDYALGLYQSGDHGYYDTGIVPNSTTTLFVECIQPPSAPWGGPIGQYESATVELHIYGPWCGDTSTYYRNGGSKQVIPGSLSGNYAVNPTTAYKDGLSAGALTGAWAGVATKSIYIWQINGAGGGGKWEGRISSIAIYKIALTANKIANVAWAMGVICGRVVP